MRVSMQNVADKAGVSRMTVSLALRNNPQISEETRTRIREIAKTLGYCPDPLIQRLTSHLAGIRRRPYSGTLAFVTDYPERAGWRSVAPFREAFEAASLQANELGYQLEEFWLREAGMTGTRLSRILEARGVKGIIIGPLPPGKQHMRLDWSRFSIVAIGNSMIRPQVHRAVHHQLHGAREAIRRLHRLGYRRIGLCVEAYQDKRVDLSYSHALAYYQQGISERNRVPALMPVRLTRDLLLRWIDRHAPDGILVQGTWASTQLAAAGFRIPDDVGVVLMDWPSGLPDFAGINQHHDSVGSAVVNMLVGQINRDERGLPTVPFTTMVEGCWQPGISVRDRTPINRVPASSA